MEQNRVSALLLGVFLLAGAAVLGYQLSDTAIRFKQLERSVTVKGLAEREYPADVVIWPIQYSLAGNDLQQLYAALDQQAESIRAFLLLGGIEAEEISFSPPPSPTGWPSRMATAAMRKCVTRRSARSPSIPLISSGCAPPWLACHSSGARA